MSLRDHWRVSGLAALLVLASTSHAEETPAQRQSMEELRNTVINLLQALVQKGLLTREQAEALVKQAQDKAAADVAAQASKNATQAKEDQNAVRVPYVPQIIKDDIAKQVEQEVKPAVVADVEKDAKQQGWGIPGALPDWLSRVRVLGDITVRYQGDMFPHDNASKVADFYDYQAINTAGGLANTTYPFLDTTQDRNRLRERVRLGVEADVTPHVKAVVRLASGSLTDPGSESQTFGTYGERYTVGFDQAYIAWNSGLQGQLSADTLEGGRLPNPWFAPTELIYARDLTFEGVANSVRLGWGEGASDRSHVYLTLGGFPILEVPLVNEDNKWLVGGQLGAHLRFNDGADHLNVAVAYYDFLKVTGQQNVPGSTQLNFTAPPFVRYGNTMFDIANNTIPNSTSQLWALASRFRLADVAATFEHSFSRYSLALTADAVRNIGYNRADVAALSGREPLANENTGYVGELSFGNPVVDQFGLWRVAVGYRFVRSDAVIDAWTDADFHEGGTNAAGYYVWAMYGLTHNTWMRLRYLSANQVDGPNYGLDIVQLDVNARF